jgi:hypothetical protein
MMHRPIRPIDRSISIAGGQGSRQQPFLCVLYGWTTNQSWLEMTPAPLPPRLAPYIPQQQAAAATTPLLLASLPPRSTSSNSRDRSSRSGVETLHPCHPTTTPHQQAAAAVTAAACAPLRGGRSRRRRRRPPLAAGGRASSRSSSSRSSSSHDGRVQGMARCRRHRIHHTHHHQWQR